MHRIAAAFLAASFLALGGLAPVPAPAPAEDNTGAIYKRLTDTVGPALVTVKFIMKVEGGRMGDEGQDMEFTGLMMEPGGLVLVESFVKMGGRYARAGMTANPTNIKILIGDDTEGLKARFLARDSELDLCWLQIDDDKARGKTFTAVDFASGAVGAVGDRVFAVERMGKFFDHALSVSEGRIGGAARKPRALLIPTGFSFNPEMLGAPLFNSDGKVVGVNIVQMPDKEDVEGGESGQGDSGVLLLPAAEVVKATIRGKEMAAKTPPAEEKKDEPKADKPAEPAPRKDEKPPAKP